MLAAITTRYIPATSHTGSRICARSKNGRFMMPYEAGISADQNHQRAAMELARRNDWPGTWVGAMLPAAGETRVWVLHAGHSVLAGDMFTVEGGAE